ncbi:MAG: anti-sigma factor domain-containing protein, partial [Clostridia bacterium]|nr:anti-sigma factor domain-containing protein [Clostridia bacterium]
MIYKGIVMEVNRNYCIVLTNTQEFIKLKIKKNIYESQEIYFTESDIYSQRSYAKWAFAAAIVLIGLFLSGIQINQLYPYMNPYNAAVVSIDINPSIEFYIDEKNMVTKVIPLNEEANFLVSDNWKGLTFHVVLNEYFDNAIENEYLKQESTILISCAALDDDFNKDVIIKQVNKTIQEKNVSDITYGYIESNKESVKKAQKANVSIGKFEIYNDVKDSHQDMDTIEEVKNTEVSQLIEETEIVQVINKQDKKREKDNREERYENHEEGFEDNHFHKDTEKDTYFNKNIKKLEHDKIKKERL